jgi:hypothetical protein
MSALRPLVLLALIAGIGAVVPTPFESEAWAQQPGVWPAPGLVDFLPPGEIVGDGATAVTMHVVALNAAGQPMTGLKPRVTATVGMPQGWSELGNGVYSFQFVPPKVDAAKEVTLSLRGKTAAKENVEADYKVLVRPPMSKKLTVSANPTELILGQVAEATLSFTLEGGAGQPLSGADLVMSASYGEVTNLTDMGGGRFTARYVGQKVNYPHLAIITVADRRDPSRTYGYAVVPLSGKTDYPVKAQPNASVILRIGGRDFGPVQAAADGKASVPVIVPPGVQQATLVSVVSGASNEENIDLRVPETKRLRLFPTPVGLPADASVKVPVRVVVRTPDGKPDPVAKVAFTASVGTFSEARHEGDGVYVADYTPPTGNTAQKATLTATITGSTVQVDTREVNLVPVRPTSLALTAEPTTLGADATSFKVFAKVGGPEGRGLSERALQFNAAGANLKGEVTDLRNGDYQAVFGTTGTGPVELLATVQTPSTGNPLRRVMVFPVRESLNNDGISSTMVTVLTLDEFGYPVPNVPVALQLDGDGQLPASVTTNANGIGQVFYTAGRSADLVRINATAGDHQGGTAILQAPANVAKVDLPISGSADNVALDKKWAAIVGGLRVEREGQLGAATGVAPIQNAGPITTVQARAEPATAAPGATIVLRIKATDAQGRGAAGQQLEFLTSLGRVGTVQDLGGGEYETTLVLPADATGEAKVSVAAATGASTFLKIPVAAGASSSAGAWGTTATPEPTPTPTPTPPDATAAVAPTPTVTPPVEPVKPPKEPKPPSTGDHPWLRAQAGYVGGSYRYEQRPSAESGPLLPVVFAIGGDSGGPNAKPQGFEVSGRAFPESLKYVGFDAHLRGAYYAISADAFGSATAPDWLMDVGVMAVPRYPFEAGGNAFHVGARAGFRYSDFIVFKGCLEEDCTVEYQTLALPGLSVGAEVGAEIADMFVNASIEEGLFGTTPYLTGVNVNVGYQFTDMLFADIGFEAVTRRIAVVGDTTGTEFGELSDGQTLLKLGVGYSM